MLGLRFCARAFSSCGKRGPLFIAVRGPLTIAASLVVEHRLQTRRLSSCGSRAQLLHGMWDLPRPGLEPVSPALAGRFSTTAPPGKPLVGLFYSFFSFIDLGFLGFSRISAQLNGGHGLWVHAYLFDAPSRWFWYLFWALSWLGENSNIPQWLENCCFVSASIFSCFTVLWLEDESVYLY